MENTNLATYLNDHLAGSVAGLDLLDHLCELLKGTESDADIRSIRSEITTDRDALVSQMERLDISESTFRKASGWLAEKAAALKLLVDDPGSGPLATFESLEALSLGIEGKRSLWVALGAISDADRRINAAECDEIVRRSEDQRRRVEIVRISMGKKALGPSAE